jgi:hypothetical protein
MCEEGYVWCGCIPDLPDPRSDEPLTRLLFNSYETRRTFNDENKTYAVPEIANTR